MIIERDRIMQKIKSEFPDKWWGDEFDVRFYLISQLNSKKNERILDLGGGIGIILSEIQSSNERINIDFSIKDLNICKNIVDPKIYPVCSTMTEIPFADASFDSVISGSVLQYAKNFDIRRNPSRKEYPSVEKTISEIYRILKPGGKLYLVTPNNSSYQSFMLTYDELQNGYK